MSKWDERNISFIIGQNIYEFLQNINKEICSNRDINISNKLDVFLSKHPKALIELITQSESLGYQDPYYSFTMIIFYRESM